MPDSPPATRPCRHCGGSGTELDPIAVGAAMRALRTAAGLSLHTVATALGVTAPYISDLERGNRAFNPALIARYRAALPSCNQKPETP